MILTGRKPIFIHGLRYNEIQVNRMRLQLHRSCFQSIHPWLGVSTHGFAGCMGWGSAERPDVNG